MHQRIHLRKAQLDIDETHIERRVVNNQLGALNEVGKLLRDIAKAWLVLQKFWRDAMHLHRTGVNVAFGIEIAMKKITGQTPVDHFDRGDFDNAMALIWIKAGGFGVENNLTHIKGLRTEDK